LDGQAEMEEEEKGAFPMTWGQSQFDKLLMAFFVLALTGLATASNDKVAAFALQGAAGCLGCLLTLVTARRTTGPEPTSSVTTTTSETVTPAPQTKAETPKEIPAA
jgi:hypothetical protein